MGILILTLAAATVVTPQSEEPELLSPLGVAHYPQKDEKGIIAEAEKKLAADPQNIDLLIGLGQAYASVWRYRDAIKTYSRAIEIDPDRAILYRHRGHRYISIRQLEQAAADLERGAGLDDKSYDIWYHLGLARYLRGEFARASEAYTRCRQLATSDDNLVAVSHWLYMSLRRQAREREAGEVLERIPPEMEIKENRSYFDLLMLYKDIRKEPDLLNFEKAEPLDLATVGYGLGNWYLYNGEAEKARDLFKRVTASTYWPAFGFIAAEAELARAR